jgi:hypothetical protein
MKKLKPRERDMVIDLIEKFGQYVTKKISYTELDEIILFTPNKIKESAYLIQEAMYDGHNSIRLEFEVVKKQDEPSVARKIHGSKSIKLSEILNSKKNPKHKLGAEWCIKNLDGDEI